MDCYFLPLHVRVHRELFTYLPLIARYGEALLVDKFVRAVDKHNLLLVMAIAHNTTRNPYLDSTTVIALDILFLRHSFFYEFIDFSTKELPFPQLIASYPQK